MPSAHSLDWLKFGTSIFSQMTEIANRSGAVNLAQGFPSFDGPNIIKTAAKAAIDEGMNQYAPAAGLVELRTAIAAREQRDHLLRYDPLTEVTVTSGATEAIFCAVQALCKPGDQVITFAPFYDSYPASIFAAKAEHVEVKLRISDWKIDFAALRQAITPKTRVIMLNTPHNPTGSVCSRQDLEIVADIAKEHDLWVITDEVYEHITFDGAPIVRLAGLPGMRERTVTISSFSKSFSLTGWKVGYCFAAPEVTRAIRGVHQFVVFCSATPLQWGLLAALQLPQNYITELQAFYQERRDFLLAALNQAGFRCQSPQGSYFILADYAQIRDIPDHEFAIFLTEHAKVACVPISVFYKNPAEAATKSRLVRFAFCKDIGTLEQASHLLQKNL